ncbi:355_t:CDS:2 [Entrophospora sp. SA101]|nr:1672_t:CDS:2 [Entrophospora candida]CAG8513828.1 1932_t:CDS:2 [Entrophospora candida]CAH1759596.1 355_t:CDS:2 [Entrophospora sp. SA101]
MSISQITSDFEEPTVGETSTNLLRDERIILNVGGIKYETCRSTLTAYPETLLGTMFHQRNREMLHPTNGNEYFIDRNGYAFYYILEFYHLEQEFSYFQIPFTSKHDLAEKAAGELLDDFAYAIEELLCLAISKLVDRISITFYRDGSKDIKKYLENNFSNMIIKLDFGNNYKSLTLSMSRLFTRNTIKKHSKIGMLTRSE